MRLYKGRLRSAVGSGRRRRKGCKTMSDKLLFWINSLIECMEENKRLREVLFILKSCVDGSDPDIPDSEIESAVKFAEEVMEGGG